ncbi:uncharacterized protein F4812DRAFT_391475 [Daldinia caldariorum]|uniref:uncharacterized protein n=1 Tax=Daldinia caldariorum TaxID=326644 RepID=UPI0020087E1B|nr:uncharacterized protein F4812DRAFT_391475 [Daldinia caldariorum]KAI1468120.1 hypothetical protein F4812DRAFT_391475 [Daldinia caldariorum]
MARSKTTGVYPLSTRNSFSAGVTSTLDSRVQAGKGNTTVRKQWADEPWPLIKVPSRTKLTKHAGHPVQHIVREVTNTHNAMLRGLNALYIQAPYVRLPADVADFCFLGRVWACWVKDYHNHKESVMIPKFEDALGLERGSLKLTFVFSEGEGKWMSNGKGEGNKSKGKGRGRGRERGNGKGKEKEGEYTLEGNIPALVHNVLKYVAATHVEPTSYSSSTLQTLLSSLASLLVPHLHEQIPLLQQMQDICLNSLSPSGSVSPIPTPLSINSTNSTSSSSPSSPPSSVFIPISSPPSSFPSQSSLPKPEPNPNPNLNPNPKPPAAIKSALLTQAHLSTLTSFSPSPSLSPLYPLLSFPSFTPSSPSSRSPSLFPLDPYTSLPMLVRLRDASYDARPGDGHPWPRLSVPALHAVADRLSAPHRGCWRFLPCDVWGRPAESAFLPGRDEEQQQQPQ